MFSVIFPRTANRGDIMHGTLLKKTGTSWYKSKCQSYTWSILDLCVGSPYQVLGTRYFYSLYIFDDEK